MNENNGKAKVRQVYPTLEAAKSTPGTEKERVVEVLKDGATVGFVWAGNPGKGLLAVVRQNGWSAKLAEPKGNGPLTKERLAGALKAMSDEDRAILIAQFVPAPKKTKTSK
jgi:hypothetical protein